MAKWAKENPTEFYRIYARMLPKEVEASVEHKHTPTRDEIVAAGAALGLSEEMLFDDAGPSTKAH